MAFDLKKEVKEIAQIAKSCPEEFRLKCFEVLLNDALGRAGVQQEGRGTGKQAPPTGASRQFHSFCKDKSVIQDGLSNVFDFSSDDDFIQVSDFKQRTKAKQQVVIALLAGVKSLYDSGIASVNDELLRKLTQKHKVYSRPNFAKYMQTYRKYFNPAAGGGWKLTPDGLNKASEVVNALGAEGATFKL